MRKISLTVCIAILSACFSLCAKDYIVTEFGACPDSPNVQTAILQKVIDKCHDSGGGTVHFPCGTYISGTLFMRDNVILELGHGAVLKGSGKLEDYPELQYHRKGLIHAENVQNSGICGTGTIDANGNNTIFHQGPKSPLRIYAANFEHCTGITISGVSLINASYWTLRLDDCEQAIITGIKIHSTCYFNNDGIDIDGRDIIVSDCIIDCIDDAICIKSYYPEKPCENITITGCIVSSNCNAIKMGTASEGGFRNIAISNCVIRRPSQNDYFDYKKYIIPGITDNYTNNSGIALELVDGGIMEQVAISDITMENTLTPIFIRLAERRNPPAGRMSGISISNITATANSLMSCSITGIPGHYIEDISLSHIILKCPGGGKPEHRFLKIPEADSSYPENKIFGAVLPAYGFFVRHAKNISFDDITFRMVSDDNRYALHFIDCSDIYVNNVRTFPNHGTQPYIKAEATERITATLCSDNHIAETESATDIYCNDKTQRSNKYTQHHVSEDPIPANISLVKWSFRTQTEILCDIASRHGIRAIDMADPLKWETIISKGLEVSVADGVDLGVERGFCDRKWHRELQERYMHYLPILAEYGIKKIICYSGSCPGQSTDESLKICAEGLAPIVRMAEDLDITVVMELLSSRPGDNIFTTQSFKDYVCDTPEWGIKLCNTLGSEHFKLLYDVWHMYDMGRDIFSDVSKYHKYIGHYHISGFPDRKSVSAGNFDYKHFRHLLEKTGYTGYVGLELDRIENDIENIVSKSITTINTSR